MDNIDLVILKILQDNGRETASSISKRIHLSVSAVLDRIHKLEENGVVKKYTVLLDSRKLGYDVLAVMEVRLEHPRFYDSFVEAVQSNPNSRIISWQFWIIQYSIACLYVYRRAFVSMLFHLSDQMVKSFCLRSRIIFTANIHRI